MNKTVEWRDESKTILAIVEGNDTTIVEPHHPLWEEFSKLDDIIPFVKDAVDERLTIIDKRNKLLFASDWTQLSDAPVDQTAWAAYRQALRDITSQEGFPANVVWPTKPE